MTNPNPLPLTVEAPGTQRFTSNPPPIPEVVVDLDTVPIDPNTDTARLVRLILRRGSRSLVVHVIAEQVREPRPRILMRGVHEYRDVERSFRARLWDREV